MLLPTFTRFAGIRLAVWPFVSSTLGCGPAGPTFPFRWFALSGAPSRLRPSRWLLLVPLLLTVAAGAAPAQSGDATQETEVTAFVGVHVLPMTDADRPVLRDRTVLVRGDTIARVGAVSEVTVPEGARRIEGDERYLLPGMAELHGHVPDPEERPQYTRDVLWLFLANGVTTVRGMLGQPGHLELRERANSGAIASPTLYLAGPPFTGGSVDGPEDAEQMVRAQAEAGWDYLKVLEGMNPEEYAAMARTARELEMPFVGHVPDGVGLEAVLQSGQETIDHLDGYVQYLDGSSRRVPRDAIDDVVARTKEAGVWVVPTMALWETLVGAVGTETLTRYTELRYMPPGMVENWIETQTERRSSDSFDPAVAERVIANRMRLLEALHEADARIVFGTDAPQQFSVPGYSIHREIDRMVRAGMDPYAVVRTATSAAGAYFAEKDLFGTVESGARADLVLVTENPLEDLEHLQDPDGVMVRGRWLARTEIEEQIGRIAQSYGQAEGADWGQF